MKNKLLLILLLISSLAFTQIREPHLRVADSTTQFGNNLPAGYVVLDVANKNLWMLTAPATLINSLSTVGAKFLLNSKDSICDTCFVATAGIGQKVYKELELLNTTLIKGDSVQTFINPGAKFVIKDTSGAVYFILEKDLFQINQSATPGAPAFQVQPSNILAFASGTGQPHLQCTPNFFASFNGNNPSQPTLYVYDGNFAFQKQGEVYLSGGENYIFFKKPQSGGGTYAYFQPSGVEFSNPDALSPDTYLYANAEKLELVDRITTNNQYFYASKDLIRFFGAYDFPTTSGTSGQVLTSNGGGTMTWQTIAATPAGSNTEIQYNNSGALGANSGFTWASDVLNIKQKQKFTNVAGGGVMLAIPSYTSTITTTYTLPISNGTNGQVLTENGSGSLSWTTPGTNKWTFGGDALESNNNFLGSTDNRSVKMGVNGTTCIKMDSATKAVLIGSTIHSNDAANKLQVGNKGTVTTTNIINAESIFSFNNDNGVVFERNAATTTLVRPNITLLSGNGQNTAGSYVGIIAFSGVRDATTANLNAALISSQATESFAAGKAGTNLLFSTTTTGTSTRVDRMIIVDGKIGISNSGNSVPSSPTHNLSFQQGGNVAISGEAATAQNNGYDVSISGMPRKSGATDANGGKTIIGDKATSTGTGTSIIEFQTATAGSSGTTDNNPTVKASINGEGRFILGADADGAYSFLISGTDLLIQRKETGYWVTKQTITP